MLALPDIALVVSQQLPDYLRRQVLGRYEPILVPLQHPVPPLLETILPYGELVPEGGVAPLGQLDAARPQEQVGGVYLIVEHLALHLEQLHAEVAEQEAQFLAVVGQQFAVQWSLLDLHLGVGDLVRHDLGEHVLDGRTGTDEEAVVVVSALLPKTDDPVVLHLDLLLHEGEALLLELLGPRHHPPLLLHHEDVEQLVLEGAHLVFLGPLGVGIVREHARRPLQEGELGGEVEHLALLLFLLVALLLLMDRRKLPLHGRHRPPQQRGRGSDIQLCLLPLPQWDRFGEVFLPPLKPVLAIHGKLAVGLEGGLALDDGHPAVLVRRFLEVVVDELLDLPRLGTLPLPAPRAAPSQEGVLAALPLQTGVPGPAEGLRLGRVALVAIVASSPHEINLISPIRCRGSLVEGAEPVVGAFVEAGGAAVDDELREGEDAADVVLDLYVVVLELVVHLVEDGHHLRYPEIHPHQLARALPLAPQETHHLVEVHPEALVHVLLPRPLPTDLLLVLPVAQLQVVLHQVPVNCGRSRQPHPVLGLRAQQLQPVVLVQDVDHHGLDAAHHLLPVLEVGQLDGGVLLEQARVVLLLPLVLGEEDVLALLVGDQDVLEHQPHHLRLTADGPVDQGYLLPLRDLYLLGQPRQPLLLRLHLLLLLFLLLLLLLQLVSVPLARTLRVGEDVVLRLLLGVAHPVASTLRVVVGVAVHPVRTVHSVHRVAAEATHPSQSSHATHAAHSAHAAHPAEASVESSEASSKSPAQPPSQPPSESSPKAAESSAKSSSEALGEVVGEVWFSIGFSEGVSIAIPVFLFFNLVDVVVIELVVGLFILLAHMTIMIDQHHRALTTSQNNLPFSIMHLPKKSMDEISLELTEKCIELDSRKDIPSEVRLEYSKTQLSIQEIPEPHSPLLSIYEHSDLDADKSFPKAHRYFKPIDLNENLYNIESPEHTDKFKGYHMPRNDRCKENESMSLQGRAGKSRISEARNRCRSLCTRAAFPPKLAKIEKEQQTYKALKMRLEEEKRKYQPFRVTFKSWDMRKLPHPEERHSIGSSFNDFFAKKIKLDYNETQEKRYLQRIIMNRQSILHVSQRLGQLPAIRAE